MDDDNSDDNDDDSCDDDSNNKRKSEDIDNKDNDDEDKRPESNEEEKGNDESNTNVSTLHQDAKRLCKEKEAEQTALAAQLRAKKDRVLNELLETIMWWFTRKARKSCIHSRSGRRVSCKCWASFGDKQRPTAASATAEWLQTYLDAPSDRNNDALSSQDKIVLSSLVLIPHQKSRMLNVASSSGCQILVCTNSVSNILLEYHARTGGKKVAFAEEHRCLMEKQFRYLHAVERKQDSRLLLNAIAQTVIAQRRKCMRSNWIDWDSVNLILADGQQLGQPWVSKEGVKQTKHKFCEYQLNTITIAVPDVCGVNQQARGLFNRHDLQRHLLTNETKSVLLRLGSSWASCMEHCHPVDSVVVMFNGGGCDLWSSVMDGAADGVHAKFGLGASVLSPEERTVLKRFSGQIGDYLRGFRDRNMVSSCTNGGVISYQTQMQVTTRHAYSRPHCKLRPKEANSTGCFAIVPTTKSGVFLHVWGQNDAINTAEGRQKRGNLFFVPFGAVLVGPSSLVCGDGFVAPRPDRLLDDALSSFEKMHPALLFKLPPLGMAFDDSDMTTNFELGFELPYPTNLATCSAEGKELDLKKSLGRGLFEELPPFHSSNP